MQEYRPLRQQCSPARIIFTEDDKDNSFHVKANAPEPPLHSPALEVHQIKKLGPIAQPDTIEHSL
jgi:hypothetical protein